MRVFFSLIIIPSALSACLALQATNTNTLINHQSKPTLYKVFKIKNLNTVHLIYAIRNDSIFEIVSRKQDQAACVDIKKGHYYPFILQSNLENKKSPLYTPRSNRLLVTHSTFYGTAVPLESRARYDLYTASNLNGLCLK